MNDPNQIRAKIAEALSDLPPDVVARVQAFALAVNGGMEPNAAAAATGVPLQAVESAGAGLASTPTLGSA